MEWFPDEKFIVSASHDFTIIIWNVSNGSVHQRLEGPSNYVKAVSIEPMGRFISVLSCDRTLRVFKSKKKRPDLFFIKHSVQKFVPFNEEVSIDDEKYPRLLLPESDIEK